MRIHLLSILMIIAASVWSAGAGSEVYRSIDADGNIIFSDTPLPGSEKIELRETTVVPALKIPAKSAQKEERRGDAGKSADYKEVRITSPANESTFRNIQDIPVNVSVTPGLRAAAGHTLQLYLDGSPYGEPSAGTAFVLQNVERGAHEVSAAVMDKSGQQVLRSEAVTFFLHKQTVNPQARPAT